MKIACHSLLALILSLGVNTLTEGQDPLGFDTKLYQYHREILGVATGEGLGTVILDPEVYRHSGPDHGKLRLVKEDGESFTELPWIVTPVERPPAPAGEQHIPHRIESFEENEDGSIELIVALRGETSPPARVEIRTPLRDFEKSVTVSTTTDGGAWAPLLSDGLVFDYERFLDFRRTSLDLPESRSRRFKVRISDATDQQRSLVKELSRTVSDAAGVTVGERGTVRTRLFRIDEIRFFTAATKRGKNEEGPSYDLEILEQKPDQENKSTAILFGGGGLPLREMTLDTTERNFRREVSLQIPDKTTSETWRSIHRGRIHRFHVGGFHDESLSLRFSEVRSDRYRLVIENEDSPPLSLSSVTGRGDEFELLFLASAGDRISLFLGSPLDSLTKPQFDTAAIVAAKNQRVRRERFELGGLSENTDFHASLSHGPGLLDSKPVLWSAIALVVAMMILVLFQTLKRIDAIEEEN